ncbi:SDR family NAD(P)-dependent oxidoreductase [Peterkaempfera bronchialis]|uniref:SDR family oxidoreductase n=1 Tax=Peterkaempfera bronchialis TaxID=2126346 RepID=A0A345SR86_9ACTN|nr:glucose 1-dehydrogenase [Peterkaempfera bronchialis]AXI76241.1 SDR family oxidoreductase [Peterkaempfera bronchialis]
MQSKEPTLPGLFSLTGLFSLSGQTALVTGASGGLGRAQCLALGAAGARVIVSDLDPEAAQQACDHLAEQGVDCVPLELDVTSTHSVNEAFDALDARGDSPDILVNNAGVSLRNSALEATEDEFDLTLTVNLRGTYFTAQRAARTMSRRGGGRIVNISSIGGLAVDGERSSVYDASKAAVVQVTRNMAYEWGRHGIRVNSIAPGYMRTAMTSDLLPSREVEERIVRDHIPLGRVGEPGDLSGAVLFLASQASAYVTGHTLTVDGGWLVAL